MFRLFYKKTCLQELHKVLHCSQFLPNVFCSIGSSNGNGSSANVSRSRFLLSYLHTTYLPTPTQLWTNYCLARTFESLAAIFIASLKWVWQRHSLGGADKFKQTKATFWSMKLLRLNVMLPSGTKCCLRYISFVKDSIYLFICWISLFISNIEIFSVFWH